MYRKSLSFIYVITLFLFVVLLNTPYHAGDGLFFSVICLTALESFLIKNSYRSLLFITINIILIGLMFIVYLFFNPYLLHLQAQIIFDYILFCIICFSFWFIMYAEFSMKEDLVALSQQLETLKKLQKNTGILSDIAFHEQEQYILNGARRRNESCYYLHIHVNTTPDDVGFSALMATLDDYMIRTFRQHYDIIKKQTPTSYLCLLQNVDSGTIEIVKLRLLNNLNEVLVAPETFIVFEEEEVVL